MPSRFNLQIITNQRKLWSANQIKEEPMVYLEPYKPIVLQLQEFNLRNCYVIGFSHFIGKPSKLLTIKQFA